MFIGALTKNLSICPCHGSRFSTDGAVINGSAQTDLNPIQIK
ncbi:Rieske 2Fe-2S domain-containing protein [Flavobacterium chungbukense]|nr:Rieske 2Fe-2S domain-containing protein [Flavobacterium chungbukense]